MLFTKLNGRETFEKIIKRLKIYQATHPSLKLTQNSNKKNGIVSCFCSQGMCTKGIACSNATSVPVKNIILDDIRKYKSNDFVYGLSFLVFGAP